MTKQGPGYNADVDLFSADRKTVARMVDELVKFIEPAHCRGKHCTDIGPYNPKMDILKERLGLEVEQVYVPDYNFNSLAYFAGKHDVVFCFEVLEHLQNPLWFIRQIKQYLLAPGGVIYLSMPSNPHFLRYPFHFHEMRRDMLQTWILEPLGLKIVRHRRFNFVNNWRSMFIGIRPLLRAIRTRDIRPILWGFIQINNFYEIRAS